MASVRLPESFDFEEILNAVVYPLYKRLAYRSHLVVLIENKAQAWLMRAGFTKSTFPKTLMRSQMDSGIWDVTAEIAADIAGVAKEHGVPIFFVILPTDYQVDDQLGKDYERGSSLDLSLIDLGQSNRMLVKKINEYGLQVFDTTGDLKRAFLDGQKPYAAFDRHLSRIGHHIVVNKILTHVGSLLDSKKNYLPMNK